MKQRHIQALTTLLAFVALAAAISLARSTAQTASLSSAPQTPARYQAVEDDPQVQALRGQLADPALSEEGRRTVEKKLIMAERMAWEVAAGQAAPRTEKIAPALPAEPAQAALQIQAADEDVLFEGSEGLVRPSLALIINGWEGSRGGARYQVFAGSTPAEPFRGALVVVELEPGRPTGAHERYLAPDGTTMLRILEATETGLILEGDAGARLFFNLALRSFSP
jgi:hypothetical protein